MKNKVLLNVLLCGLCVFADAQEWVREFHFVNVSLNWTEAKQFCRQHYTDLASITNTHQSNSLPRPQLYSGDAWIGLFYYTNWGEGHPQLGDYCPVISSANGFWYDRPCSKNYFYICYRDSSERQYFLINYPYLNWTLAQTYCREHYTDLALIENKDENKMASPRYNYDYVAWIGHQMETWSWSDKSLMTFTHWQSGRPLGWTNGTCVVEGVNHYWRDQSCDLRLPFYCYKAVSPKRTSVLKMTVSSNLDMSDPNSYRMVSQLFEDKLKQSGHSDAKVTWSTPPKIKKR